jgi:hypothetical protein
MFAVHPILTLLSRFGCSSFSKVLMFLGEHLRWS